MADVLDDIAAAQDAGFENIKVNMVVKKGTNDHEIVPMANHFKGSGIILRFIEFMDVGSSNGWNLKSNPSFANKHRYVRMTGSQGVGILRSMSELFCHSGSRPRKCCSG